MTVQEIASLHEKTVQDVANGGRQKPRRRRGIVEPDEADVLVRQVVPLVWDRALRLAGGDHRRIEVVSETEVIVHN